MSLIKIIAKNIELDFVKETLSIKKENNALNRDFKVSYSSIPFLIIENANTKKALGTRDLSSVKKIKTIDVIVFEGGKKYSGELQILSYLNGFRKCNLKYASSLLSIMNKKISEFMPIVSVIPGETNPVPFTEKSQTVVAGSENWQTYATPFLTQSFPEVKWQFPTMDWAKKFGENLTVEDHWYLYEGRVNKYDTSGLILNTYNIDGSGVCTVVNKNTISPQVYVLSPAFYALESLGFTLAGDFSASDFIKRILFYSNKQNINETTPLKTNISEVLSPLVASTKFDSDPISFYDNYYSIKEITIDTVGTYYFEYDFTEPNFSPTAGSIDFKLFQVYVFDEPEYNVYKHFHSSGGQTYKGTVKIETQSSQIGKKILIRYYTPEANLPANYLKKKVAFPKVFHQMHPTIPLGRYLPDWTFATYLNALQNIFNLEINIDDFSKKMIINFNENAISTSAKAILKKSLALTGYEQTPSNAFLLKYENDEDVALWITKEGAMNYGLQTSNFVERLDNKFKFVPTTYTAELSEALDSKNGIGLMIYDPVEKPYISSNYLGQTLKIEGSKGIYEVFWRKFIKFLLNGSAVEMSGPFTEKELNEILSLKRIFVDNQEYLISSTESRETDQNNYEVKFNLVSVTF
jgi:hypothetical protein